MVAGETISVNGVERLGPKQLVRNVIISVLHD